MFIYKFNQDMQISLTYIAQSFCVFQIRSLLGPSTPLPSFVLSHRALSLDGFHTEELVPGYVHISIPVTYSDIKP